MIVYEVRDNIDIYAIIRIFLWWVMDVNRLHKFVKSSILLRILTSVIGITVNVALAFVMNMFRLPLFLDTVGTVAVSAITGLFPGIFTAVATNAICALFDVNAIYFGFMNALVAIYTAWFIRRHTFKKLRSILAFIAVLAVFTGAVSSLIKWFLLNGVEAAAKSETVILIETSTGLSLFWSYFSFNIIMNILDKGIAVLVAWLVIHIVPQRIMDVIEAGNWRQKPIDAEEIAVLNSWGKDLKYSMRRRTSLMIIATSVLLVLVTGWSGIRLYFSKVKESMTIDACNIVRMVSELVDPEQIRAFISNGYSGEEYEQTEAMLWMITESSSSIENLALVRFTGKEARPVFVISKSENSLNKAMAMSKYDSYISPYIPKLLAGEEIPPVEHGDINSWIRSVFKPLKDSNGNLICYIVADISITYVADYMGDFIIRSVLILMGFFIMVMALYIWYTNTLMVYPIRSLSKCVDDFSNLGYEQEQLDQNVRSIRNLGINTEDELEKLYESICRMTLNLSEQMRDLRRLSEATAKMQDGLIITMADMVERRDSDTGEHIQKTALYVKIIVEGLHRKGYYAGKITPKFMSDVVRSAPLHDIGKINIPDKILNKPGKLTPEEFEIMKTHAEAGKKIMEDAISTVQGENYLKEARNMAAYHHERWDGKGYPDGLHGEVIPLSARIMAVADVFDALTSPRVYKQAFPLEKALDIITEESGKQFDPKCVEVFLESLPEVKVILRKYNNM